jgi:23S rRNA (cytosine1962-C5)-methyltransferase
VDRYGEVAVVHADTPALLAHWLPALREDLGEEFPAAYTKVHPRQVSQLTADQRRELAPAASAWGPPVDQLKVVEHGARYLVRPAAGLSVGLFLDMREVRGWIRQSASGLTVLNLFAYTCSFGVSAALGGARRVLNLDVSRNYLEWGKANYGLNALPVNPRDFVYGEAFDWLARFARRDERFDLVIVDPPSFSSTPFSVQRDYPRLVKAAAQVVAPAGILLAATNHAGTSDEHFDAWLRGGLKMASRDGQLAHSWHEPAVDFPVAADRPPYLKVRALVLD